MGRRRTENKTISLSFRLTVDQYLALKKRADRQRLTLSAYVIAKAAEEPPDYRYWRPQELKHLVNA